MAVYSATAGFAAGTGAVTFDQAFNQYLDGGLHTFDIASNGGFTAVAVFMFTGTAENEARIMDFGSGVANNNILMWRDGATGQLNFGIWNGNSACVIVISSVIQQNNWLTIVVTYDSTSTTLKLSVGQSTQSSQTNRNVVNTFIGRSFW